MIKRQTIAAILTTTAMAYSIATPAQAASLLDGPRLDVAACSNDKPATAAPTSARTSPRRPEHARA